MKPPRRGFALITTLWLIVAIATVALEFSLQARERRRTAISISERGQAYAAAMAGVATTQARLGRLATAIAAGQTSDVPINADVSDPLGWADSLFTGTVNLGLGVGSVDVLVRDAGTILPIAAMNEQRWRSMLRGFGIDDAHAEQIAQSIEDWVDLDNDPRGRGAEREDYVRAGRLILPTNRPLQDVPELKHVLGMTPEIYARISPFLSGVIGSPQINVNKADPIVLRTIPGMTDEGVAAILNQRYSGIRIKNYQEFLRLVPGIENAQPSLGANQPSPLQFLVAFSTQQVMVTSIGRSIGGQTYVMVQARLIRQAATGVQRITILGRQVR